MKKGYLETGKSRQCSTHADHKSGHRDERLRVWSYVCRCPRLEPLELLNK